VPFNLPAGVRIRDLETDLHFVVVEEDGEDIFSPMPKRCLEFKCNGAVLEQDRKGFMYCPACGGSYGKG